MLSVLAPNEVVEITTIVLLAYQTKEAERLYQL